MVVYMDALGNNPLGLKLENRVAISSGCCKGSVGIAWYRVPEPAHQKNPKPL